jgi:hypothetical protein
MHPAEGNARRSNIWYNARVSSTLCDTQFWHSLALLYMMGLSIPPRPEPKECVRQCVDSPGNGIIQFPHIPREPIHARYGKLSRRRLSQEQIVRPTKKPISHKIQQPPNTRNSQVSSLLHERISEFPNKPIPLLGFPRRDRNTDQDLADIWKNQGMSGWFAR